MERFCDVLNGILLDKENLKNTVYGKVGLADRSWFNIFEI